MVTWWFTTFMAPAIKTKVHSLPGIEHLYPAISKDQLEIPAYITEYDMAVSCFFFNLKYLGFGRISMFRDSLLQKRVHAMRCTNHHYELFGAEKSLLELKRGTKGLQRSHWG